MTSYFNSWWTLRGVIMLLLLLCHLSISNAQSNVSVIVKDAKTNEPIPSVHIHSKNFRGITDSNGSITLPQSLNPEAKVKFAFIGYKPYSTTLAKLRNKPIVHLHFDAQILDEVAVNASRTLVERTKVGSLLKQDEIQLDIANDLGEKIESVKGVSLIKSGTSSVPVIHGLYGDRILVVQDGVRIEGQQWNIDLGPTSSLQNSNTISVIKGAEAVRYGSDALGGVIKIQDAPLPYSGKRLGGVLQQQFDSNGNGYTTAGSIEGNMLNNGSIAYRLNASYSNFGDKSSANYLINNTGLRSFSGTATLGYKNRRFSIEAQYQYAYHLSGKYLFAQMGESDLLEERIKLGRPLPEIIRPFSRKIDVPKHKNRHQFATLSGTIDLRRYGKLLASMVYQNDYTAEYHYRIMNRSNLPVVSLLLHNIQGDLSWQARYTEKWQGNIGAHINLFNNFTDQSTGVTPLIPNYIERSYGIFLVQKYTEEKWGAEAGIRADNYYLNAAGYNLYGNYYGGEHRGVNVTFNSGAFWQITDKLQIKSNIGSAWRAPNVSQLYSNGLNSSGAIYQMGNKDLKSEQNFKWITALNFKNKHLELELEGYLQWVQNYIYLLTAQTLFPTLSGKYPLFNFTQSNAYLHGLDFSAEWHILPSLSYQAQTDMIWARDTSSNRFLPFIPPFRLSNRIVWQPKFSFNTMQSAKLSLGHKYTAKQTRFDSETDLTPPPAAYHLFDLALLTVWEVANSQKLIVNLSVDNLFNVEYKDYTNLARYYNHDLGRNITLSIKYNF